MVKNDRWIKKMAQKGMIEPFEEKLVKGNVISYGVNSYGYDIRVADEFKIFENINNFVIDPKDFDHKNFIKFKGDVCIIPPNSFALARSVEYFRIPRNVIVLCLEKSIYTRCGIIINVTPLEPEWKGFLTIEISNTAPIPVKVYANEGIAQLVFIKAEKECEISYADRKGECQNQQGIVLSKI